MKTQLHFCSVAPATQIARRARRMRATFFYLALLLAVCTTGTALVQTGTPNTAWYAAQGGAQATTFTISDADQLAGIAATVKAGNDYQGKNKKYLMDFANLIVLLRC